jgi:hypothetical protein
LSLADLLVAAAILAGAAWLLYRSLWRSGGACHGCAGACRSVPRDAPGLVRLGRAERARPSGDAAL